MTSGQTPFRPLAGIKVIDFSHVIAGPLASFYLAQMGADVVKVESPSGGDVMRTARGAESFLALNAGKRELRLDLGVEADRQQAIALAADADVFLDSLRPGALERRGLGAEALQALNPRLIYCTISGYGRQGPWADRPAYDHVVQAATGMMMTTGVEGDGPIKAGFPLIDAATGILAALAIVSAVRERDLTGRGRVVDCAMSAAALQLMYPLSCLSLTVGEALPRIGNQGFSGSPAADLFETADGWIALGANTPPQFLALLTVLGLSDLAADPDLFDAPNTPAGTKAFLRARDPRRLRERLAEVVRTWAGEALEEACATARVPAAKVRDLREFTALVRQHDALGLLPLEDGDVTVLSPGLGFRVT
jgi:crotonobetainyl-CoA:carnitine CoA-transferase CaiB-like acyl-CoA transferase